MPSILNEEILQDIVKEIGKNVDENERVEALTKFMLSGKQPFEATLNLFSRTCTIKFRKSIFDLFGCLKGKNWRFCGIPYNFGLLKPAIKRLLQNVNEVEIYATPENAKDLSLMEKFITKNLQKFFTKVPLPAKFMIMLQECKLERLRIARFNDQQFDPMLLHDVFMIPAEIYEFQNRFYPLFKSFCTGWVYDNVEKLEINQSGEDIGTVDMEKDNKRLTLDRVQRFVNILINSFPNLKHIQAYFSNPSYSSQDRFDLKKFIQPELFKDIPPRIKGKISFSTGDQLENPEDEGFVLIEGSRNVVKKFSVHELAVEVVIFYEPWRSTPA